MIRRLYDRINRWLAQDIEIKPCVWMNREGQLFTPAGYIIREWIAAEKAKRPQTVSGSDPVR